MTEGSLPTDSISSQVKETIKKGGEEIAQTETTHMRCRSINGRLLLRLTNEHQIPGIIYTVLPLERDDFVDRNWTFHSVGVVRLSEGQYLAFDQTNPMGKDTSTEKFFAEGTLDEISQKLKGRFGSDWDLDFATGDPARDQTISVSGKIAAVGNLIKRGQKFSMTDITIDTPEEPPTIVDKKGVNKPLGIKYMPQPKSLRDSPGGLKIRERFTFGYA